MTSIDIFNPKTVYYGKLSNNYRFDIYINGILYKNVTSYIYSSILRNPSSQTQIRNLTNPRDIKPLFYTLYQKEINNFTIESIEEGLKLAIKNNPKMKDLLLSTNNRPIIYVSNNTLLGNKGQNLYGKYLEQIRKTLKFQESKNIEESKIQSEEDKIYDTYIVEKSLIDIIKSGKDISKYSNKNLDELIQALKADNLLKEGFDKETIINLAKNEKLKETMDFLYNSELIVNSIRKKYIKELRQLNILKRNSIVFDFYSDYLLDKKFPDIDKKKYSYIKNKEFEQLSYKEKMELESRLYKLYKAGMLSENLSNLIDEKLSELDIPSEEEVKTVSNLKLDFKKKPKDIQKEKPASFNNNPVYIYPEQKNEFSILSPLDIQLFKNGKFLFPTISHYMTVKLIKYSGKISMDKSYIHILSDPNKKIGTQLSDFINPKDAYKRYEVLRDQFVIEEMKKSCKEAINVKFRDKEMANILLSSDQRQINYDDKEDPILGTGRNKDGLNFVGKYLMELRTKLKQEFDLGNTKIIKTSDISSYIYDNVFMKKWVNMKLKDMCNCIFQTNEYIKTKNSIYKDIKAQFARSVLDKIYRQCSIMFSCIHNVENIIPNYFKDSVRQCKGMSKVDDEVILVLWKRIVAMIYFLVKNIKMPTRKNVQETLLSLSKLISKNKKCIKDFDGDDYDNCILSALVNVSKSLHDFNGGVQKIWYEEIETATKIILFSQEEEKIGEKPIQKLNLEKPRKVFTSKKKIVKPIDKTSIETEMIQQELLKGLELPSGDKPTVPKRKIYKKKSVLTSKKPIGAELQSEEPSVPPKKSWGDYSESEQDTDQDTDIESVLLEDDDEPIVYDITDDEEQEIDYMDENNDDYSPEYRDKISIYLSQFDFIGAPMILNSYFYNAMQKIKESNIPESIKRNRIMFFANCV